MARSGDNFAALVREKGLFAKQSYLPRQAQSAVNSERSVLVLSIPKCGTHWTKFLLTNYARQVANPGAAPLSGNEVDRYSILRDKLLDGRKAWKNPATFLPGHGYDYLFHQHVYGVNFTRDRVDQHLGPKLCVIRNPLDYLISSYFFYFSNRSIGVSEYSHPREIIPEFIGQYALAYRHMVEFVIPSARGHLVRYEDLAVDASKVMRQILDFLNIMVDSHALAAAIEFSSPDALRARNEDTQIPSGRMLVSGSFIRDASVGQWTKHLNDGDIRLVETVLIDFGVDPSAVMFAS